MKVRKPENACESDRVHLGWGKKNVFGTSIATRYQQYNLRHDFGSLWRSYMWFSVVVHFFFLEIEGFEREIGEWKQSADASFCEYHYSCKKAFCGLFSLGFVEVVPAIAIYIYIFHFIRFLEQEYFQVYTYTNLKNSVNI